MKRVVVGLVSLIGLVGLAIGIAAWKIEAIVATYKPQIQRALSDIVGTQVTLGDISV